MRRKLLLCVCVWMLILCACGNGNEVANQKTDEAASAVKELADEPAKKEEASETAVDYSCYYRQIEQVSRGIELGFPDDYVMDLEAEFAMAIRFPAPDTQYGYLLRDLNDDGIDELIFGANGPESLDGTIYDIYTLKDGIMVSTFIAWDRDRYYLCKNGAIAYESDGGAGSFSYSYYDYVGQVLAGDFSVGLRERVIYDGLRDMINPWFHIEAGIVDLEDAASITEDQANVIIAEYEYERLEFTPFYDCSFD